MKSFNFKSVFISSKNGAFIIVLNFVLIFGSQCYLAAQNLGNLKNKAGDKLKVNMKSAKDKPVENSSTGNDANTTMGKDEVKNDNQSPADNSYADYVNSLYSIVISSDHDMHPSFINSPTFDINPENHNKGAKLLQYPEAIKKLKQQGVGNSESFKYKTLIDFEKEYQQAIDERLKAMVNQYIEDAYQGKDNNRNEAMELFNYAKLLAEAMYLIMPDYNGVKAIKDEADKAYNDFAGAFNAKVFTGKVHKENAGKILFSKQPIAIGNEDMSQFTEQFNINDNVYAYAYLNGTIKDLGSDNAGYSVIIDEGNPQYINFGHNPEDLDKTWYPIEILPAPDRAIHGLDAKEFANIIANLSPRKHKVKIIMNGGYKELAIGEFEIDLTGMDKTKVMNNADLAVKNAKDNYDKSRQLPDDFKVPSKKFNDIELSEANIKNMLAKQWANCVQITKLVIGDAGAQGDWMIYKNDLDVPRYKSTSASVRIVYKGNDGWCYYVTGIFFQKEYEGGGKYSKAKFFTSNNPVRISCENCK